jgi:glycosyltransferase involved in cell wall biosynthesis
MKTIIFCCQFTDASGYASAARKYLYVLDKFLDKKKYNLKIYNSSFEGKINCSKEDLEFLKKYELKNEEVDNFINNNKYIAVFHLLPHHGFIDIKDKYLNKNIYEKAEKRINIFYWEADRIPELWRQIFSENKYDKIIAGCEWNKSIFLKDINNTPIEIIPIPFNEKKIIKTKKYFFNILSLSQWQPRKGFDILIKSFYQEFFNHEDVKLTIKTYRDEAFGVSDKEIIITEALNYKKSCTDYLKDPKCKLDIVTGILSKEKLEELYASSDIFCLTSRGEGFSIPSAEAALYGIPCVVPKLGGHTDFLDKDNNYFFDCYTKPLENMGKGQLFSSCEMNFLEPDIISVRKQLRSAYELWKASPEKLDEMGKKSKLFASQFLNEEKIFDRFIKIF